MIEKSGAKLGKTETMSPLQVIAKLNKTLNNPTENSQQNNGKDKQPDSSSRNVRDESPSPIKKKFLKLWRKQVKHQTESPAKKNQDTKSIKPRNSQKVPSNDKRRLYKEAATQDNLLEAPIFKEDYLK